MLTEGDERAGAPPTVRGSEREGEAGVGEVGVEVEVGTHTFHFQRAAAHTHAHALPPHASRVSPVTHSTPAACWRAKNCALSINHTGPHAGARAGAVAG